MSLLHYCVETAEPEIISYILKELFQAVEVASSALFQFQTVIPSILPKLIELVAELEKCKEPSEQQFKSTMSVSKK